MTHCPDCGGVVQLRRRLAAEIGEWLCEACNVTFLRGAERPVEAIGHRDSHNTAGLSVRRLQRALVDNCGNWSQS